MRYLKIGVVLTLAALAAPEPALGAAAWPAGEMSLQQAQHQVRGLVTSAEANAPLHYADVLLWKAEALIELGRHNEALPLINQIRERARNSTGRLHMADGAPAGNYHVEAYRPGVKIDWTQEDARQALRWERRLEFAMEGHRFFDLVRWGIAAETLNGYFEVERTRRDYLRDGLIRAGRDEYLPIPQQQIDFSEGLYQQNPGYN